MKDNVFDSYIHAGRIAARVLQFGINKVRIGTPIVETVESIEREVIETEGVGLAFPLNLSLNEDAAHDTAMVGDKRVFREGDLVKLDLGVHIDGYIADIASTVDLGNHHVLLESSESALEAAIGCVKPGIATGEIGGIIQREIESRGYRPIVNLTGHGLDQYSIHTPPAIPNLKMNGGAILTTGMVFAIEPFATTGSGMVSERRRIEIYQQVALKPVRIPSAKRILKEIKGRRGLPFARRWIKSDKLDIALQSLVQVRALHPYPVLHDIPGSFVSQHEHTVIVEEDGCLIITR